MKDLKDGNYIGQGYGGHAFFQKKVRFAMFLPLVTKSPGC